MDIQLIESQEVAPIPATTPAQLLTIAVQRGADLAQLERLMDLQERFEKREAEKAYNLAFTSFKAEAVEIIKNKKVTAGPLSGKTYAELHAVVEAATPALSRHGLSASWRITKDAPDWIEVTCTLRHTLGHFEAVSMGGPPDVGGAKNPIQARASTVSYLERYTFKAICGLAEKDDDDDGNGQISDPLASFKSAQQKLIRAAAQAALQAFNEGNEYLAYEEVTSCVEKVAEGDVDRANMVRMAMWSIFNPHPALRASLKKHAQQEHQQKETA